MAEPQPSKLVMRVRFPSPAPLSHETKHLRPLRCVTPGRRHPDGRANPVTGGVDGRSCHTRAIEPLRGTVVAGSPAHAVLHNVIHYWHDVSHQRAPRRRDPPSTGPAGSHRPEPV